MPFVLTVLITIDSVLYAICDLTFELKLPTSLSSRLALTASISAKPKVVFGSMKDG